MKELRVQVKIRNNRLIRLREDLGHSAPEMASLIGVSSKTLWAYEAMRANPKRTNGDWKDSALKIAAFHGVSPDYIWTPAILNVKKTKSERELDASELALLSDQPRELPAEALEDGVDLKKLRHQLGRLFAKLTPMQQQVLNMRFGLDGRPPMTLVEIAEHFGIASHGSILQVESAALRHLRSPALARRLKPFAEGLVPVGPGSN